MPSYKTPPLKRHPSLQPLSRDHYVGLVQGRRLIKSGDADPTERRAAVAAFVDAWHTDIAQHFADEERLLAPLASPEDRQRLDAEHAHLRELAAEAKQRRRLIDPGEAWVVSLGQTLTDHIRWEERTFFPALESAAGSQLEALRGEADRLEASRPRGRDANQTR
ncbi:MAG: hemerythrin domain-containing protein [Phycisphaeraceae bacterium]